MPAVRSQHEYLEQCAFIAWATMQWFLFDHGGGRTERLCLGDYVEATLNGASLSGTARQRAAQVARLKKAGMRNGSADVMIHLPVFTGGQLRYPFGHIEMKKRMDQFRYPSQARAAVSQDQQNYLASRRKVGAYTGVAYGWEHAAWHVCQMQGWNPDERLGIGWRQVVPINEG